MWRDERGVDTLEWLAIAVLILMVAFAIYPGTLQGGLQHVVNAIVDSLKTNVPTGPAGN